MRILCIDDDATMAKLYEAVLTKNLQPDDEISIARSGEEGIAMAQSNHPHVVITDLVMPGIDGLAVLSAVKNLDARIEVIVVTGQGSVDSAVAAMKLGARDYLTKPINSGMLLEKISSIREFINRLHEVEDYRIAKQTIEASVSAALLEMEVKLAQSFSCLEKIEKIIAEVPFTSAHSSAILSVIEAFRKDSGL